MSTRAHITIKNKDDGYYYTVYCHFDGYPERFLPILTVHYNTYEKVLELISGGDFRSLESNINEIDYYRDIEKDIKHTKPNKDLYYSNQKNKYVDYEYLFENDEWTYR